MGAFSHRCIESSIPFMGMVIEAPQKQLIIMCPWPWPLASGPLGLVLVSHLAAHCHCVPVSATASRQLLRPAASDHLVVPSTEFWWTSDLHCSVAGPTIAASSARIMGRRWYQNMRRGSRIELPQAPRIYMGWNGGKLGTVYTQLKAGPRADAPTSRPLIGICTLRTFDWYQNRWPWMTSERDSRSLIP